MRVLPTIIIVLTLSTTLKGQSTLDDLVLTRDQSDKWISKLEKEIKSKQLDLIKRKILQDTNIYIRQGYADGLKFDHEKAKGKRTEGYGRLLLVFNGQYGAYISNWTKNKMIIKLADFLTDNKIKSIAIMKGSQATTLYGTRADFGVILLTTKNKEIFEQIREIDLGRDY